MRYFARAAKMSAMPTLTDAGVYQLRIALHDTRPPIWRRVLVPGNWSLGALHYVIQVAMGWTNSHLHQFVVGDDYISLYPIDGITTRNAAKVALAEVALKPKFKFTYAYDFGDNWLHEVLVEKIIQPEDGVRYPVCVAGKRAGPPDDCGGPPGYESLLAIIRDPAHDEHEDMVAWLEEMRPGFDPDALDLDEVNRRLKKIRPTVLDAERNVRLFV
jgi:hypothetical protein